MHKREQVVEGAGRESVFLWGARQTGKSTLLKSMFPEALTFLIYPWKSFLQKLWTGEIIK